MRDKIGQLGGPPSYTSIPDRISHPGAIFLDVSKQTRLGLKLPQHLPYESYSRKNAGYLYAMAHGATVIYETDDDNRPLDHLTSFNLKATTSGLMYSGSSARPSVFNPYRHFGQPTLWPRGFPLSHVDSNYKDEYRLSNAWPTPVIQQGVVNGDPVMDAIFRLTRKKPNEPLRVLFDAAAPPVILPPGVFSPFNTQNTLFHKQAFWGLLIPTTINFRICDIWRGYWSQRLLWEIDGHVGFYPPNAYQQGNAHNYMKYSEDDDVMNYDTVRLISFLTNWTCPRNYTFFQCVYKLSFDMAVERFWEEGVAVTTKYWLEDLIRIGYNEPQRVMLFPNQEKLGNIQDSQKSSNWSDVSEKKERCLEKGTPVQFLAADQPSPTINPSFRKENSTRIARHLSYVAKLCPMVPKLTVATNEATQNYFEDILLVVIFNWPKYHVTHVMETIYRPLFPNILYCGLNAAEFAKTTSSFSAKGFSFVELPGITKGYFGQLCLVKAMQVNYNVTGYLVTGDDDLVNLWNFVGFNKTKIWMKRNPAVVQNSRVSWYWWKKPVGKSAYLASISSLQFLAKVETVLKRKQSGISKSSQIKGMENITRLISQNKNKIALINDEGDNELGFNETLHILDELNIKPSMFMANLKSNLNGTDRSIYAVSDFYYIPSRFRNDVIFYFSLFTSHNLFLELAIPILIYGVEHKANLETFKATNIWGDKRLIVWTFFKPEGHVLHPVKYSNLTNIKKSCEVYLPLLLRKAHGSERPTL